MMNHSTTVNAISDTVELMYDNDCITRKEYLNIKAILSNPDFNNHSVRMINLIIGPGYEPGFTPGSKQEVWAF